MDLSKSLNLAVRSFLYIFFQKAVVNAIYVLLCASFPSYMRFYTQGLLILEI